MSIFKKIFGKKVWEELADDELEAASSFSAAWNVPARRSLVGETVLDTIGLDDSSMPEELRGCRVVERRFSDGSTGVFYVGDGICADETQASVLIEAHRQSLSKAPGTAGDVGPAVLGGFSPAGSAGSVRLSQVMNAAPRVTGAAPGAGTGRAAWAAGSSSQPVPAVVSTPPVQSPGPGQWARAQEDMAGATPKSTQQGQQGAAAVQASGSTGFDVLDELPDDETVPKALRAALVVRKSDGVYYLTKDARFVPKAEAEEWLDLWERAHSPVPRPSETVRPVGEGPVEPADQADVRFAETTPARPHAVLPKEAVGPDAAGDVSPDVTPRVLEAPLQGGGNREQGGARLSPRMELDGRPVVKGWGFRDSGAEEDPWQRALEQAGLTQSAQEGQPFGGALAEELATIPQARPDHTAHATSQAGDRTTRGGPHETPTDKLKPPPELLAQQRTTAQDLGPAFRKVLRIAEAMRQDALAGTWSPSLDDAAEDVIRELCEQQIAKPWPDDRVERMVVDSVMGHGAILTSTGGLDRSLRRELEAGGKVVIVANPARLGDLDVSLVATLARLRAVGAKRAVVVRDLARLFEKVTCSDLGNYLMTRSFVEEFSLSLSRDAEAAVGKTVKVSALRRLLGDLLSTRAAISLSDVIDQVQRRHSVTLDFLKPVLIEALDPVFQSVSDELVARLKGKKPRP